MNSVFSTVQKCEKKNPFCFSKCLVLCFSLPPQEASGFNRYLKRKSSHICLSLLFNLLKKCVSWDNQKKKKNQKKNLRESIKYYKQQKKCGHNHFPSLHGQQARVQGWKVSILIMTWLWHQTHVHKLPSLVCRQQMKDPRE